MVHRKLKCKFHWIYFDEIESFVDNFAKNKIFSLYIRQGGFLYGTIPR